MVGAKLDAMQEIPHVKAPNAKGSFTGTIVGGKLKWRLTFSGLTGAASAAHIHVGAMGKAGNVSSRSAARAGAARAARRRSPRWHSATSRSTSRT